MPTKSGRVPVTIANGVALSSIAAIEGADIVGVEMPAAWDAAPLTFQASGDNTTFKDVFDDSGTELSIAAAASRYVSLVTAIKQLRGVRFLKVRSGPTGAPVNQTAARQLWLITTKSS